MNWKNSQRSLVLGSGAILGIVAFLAIIVAVQYIFLQHPKRWDLTRSGKYTLAPQSKKVLDTFKEKGIPIEVIGFFATKDFDRRDTVRDLLDQYKDAYSSFSYSFADPDKEFALAKKHQVDAYPTILIKAGDKVERTFTVDEESLTNSLMKLLRTDTKKVYFVKGHGELSPESSEAQGMSLAKDQIVKQNYEVKETVLLQSNAIPDDATMVIVAGPATDPMENEFELFRDYLGKGGKLLVTLRPFKALKLREFLKNYGFETTEDIIVDPMSRALGGGNLIPVVAQYEDFPITKNFNLASFFPEAQSVAVSKQTSPQISAKELALTSPLCWTITEAQLKSGDLKFDAKTGKKGAIPLMAVSTYTVAEPAKESRGPKETKDKTGAPPDKAESAELTDDPKDTRATSENPPAKARIVVFGSSQFASNKLFRFQANGDLFMNTVSWLAEEENLIAIRPKSTRAEPVILSGRQSLAVFLTTILLIPLAWFFAGAFVHFYRKWKVVA